MCFTLLDKQPLPDWNDPVPSIAGGIPPSVKEQILDAQGIINDDSLSACPLPSRVALRFTASFSRLAFARALPTLRQAGDVRMAAIC